MRQENSIRLFRLKEKRKEDARKDFIDKRKFQKEKKPSEMFAHAFWTKTRGGFLVKKGKKQI